MRIKELYNFVLKNGKQNYLFLLSLLIILFAFYQVSDLSNNNQIVVVSDDISYFQDHEGISFPISTPEESKRNFLSKLVFSAYAAANGFEDDVELYKVNGNIDYSDKVEWQYNGASELVISPSSDLEPGLYKIKYLTRSGDVIEKTFAWGVLAFNTDKDWYLPGEQVNVHYGVLDDSGNIICNADLLLKVFNEAGELLVEQSSSDGSILVSETCEEYRYVESPDFYSHFALEESGQYKMELVAHTINGEYSKISFINIIAEGEELPFSIKRTTATRIYPAVTYPVSIQITPKEDFNGQIVERVPESFEIELNLIREDYVSDATVIATPEFKEIRWDVEMLAGQSYELFYTYDAPDISPEYYQIEPLQIFEGEDLLYEEDRSWEIASDAVGAAMATRLWTSGFERNTTTTAQEYTSNIGTTPTISTSTVRSGTYALRTNLGSAATSGMRSTLAAADSATRTTARAYIRVATLPSTEIQVLALMDGTNYQASIRLDGSGNLKLWDEEDNAQIGSTLTSAVSTNTWYRLELQYDFGTAATGDTRVAAAIDGNIFATSSTQNHANGVRGVDVGILASATGDFYWDDMAVNQDTTANVDNWVGEGKVVLLLPDGNGTNTAWVAGTGAGDYLEVDDPPSTGFDDITTYVTCTAAGEIEDYTLASTASVGIGPQDRIRVFEGWSRARSSTATGSAHAVTVYDGVGPAEAGASNSIASTTWFTNDDTLPRNSGVVITDDIGTSSYGPITPSDVDEYQIRLTTSDCTPVHQVSAVWALVEYVPKEGGRVWSSGFELGAGTTTKEWDSTAGTVSVDSTTVRSGAYSLRANSLASATEESVTFSFVAANSDGPYYVRTYLYLATAPSADNRIIELQDSGSTARAYLELTSSGTLELYDEDGIVGSASSALSTGQWYRVEMQYDSTGAGSADTIEARIDGTNFATSSTRNLTNGITKLILGGNLNGEAQTQGDWYFDDVAINNGIGVVQTGYPGSGKIVHLHPNGDGDSTAWTNGFAFLDEIDPDDNASDSITTTSANQIELTTYEDSSVPGIPSDATITLISPGVRMSLSAGPVTHGFTILLKDATGEPYIQSDAMVLTTTTWLTNAIAVPNLYPYTSYTRPFKEAPWTPTVLDSLQVGAKVVQDSGSTLRVSTMWTLVEYIPAPMAISGTCDEYDQTTDCGDTGEIKYAVNGVLQAETEPTVSGTWTISVVTAPASGDVVTVFIDGASDSDEAVAVTKYDGSGDITGVRLYKEHLTIGSADNQTITNANLSQYDNSVSSDEDIFFDVSAGNDLTVDSTSQSSQEELYIVSGNIYQPASGGGGDISTHDVEIDGTITADSNAFNISGSWDNDATFTAGTSLVTMSATSGTETIDSTGSSSSTFGSLVFGQFTSSTTWVMNSDLGITEDLTINEGTLDSNDYDMEIGGSFYNNAVFDSASGSVTFVGSGDSLLESGCIILSTCTVGDFFDLIVNKDSTADLVTLSTMGIRVTGTLTITTGTLIQDSYGVNAEGASAVSVGSNGIWSSTSTGDLVLGGSFANAGSVVFQGTSAACGETDAISITSTSGGSQRSWTGAGSFSMNDVSVQDQGGSAAITVYSGTSVSGNNTNWTFDSVCPAPDLMSITESAGQIQIDVPDRYRMIMNLGDTDDYIVFQDRDENDATPDTTFEIYGPWIRELGSDYTLRDDGFRLTEVVEVTTSRIKLRVSGKFANEGSTAYLSDTSSPTYPISVTETYTFTREGMYVEQEMQLGPTGFGLDGTAATIEGVNWLLLETDITDASFDDTANIFNGNGETEGTASADGALSSARPYVVLPGHGTGDYQSAFVGVQRTGWFDNSDGSAEWYWDEDNVGEIDQLRAREFGSGGNVSNQHYSKWYFLLKPKAALDTEAEREALHNDNNNPDFPVYTTGSEWDDHSPTPALAFNIVSASDHDVNVGNNSALDFNDTMTLEAWIYRVVDTGGFDSIFSRGAGSGVGYQLGVSTNDDLEIWDGTTLVSNGNIIGLRKWQHIAAVVDNNVVTFYLNGENVGGGAWTLDLAGSNNLYFGTTNGASENFRGYLDEIRAWNVARTQQQIVDDMYHQIDPSTSGLVGYWKFNENSGTATHDETTNDSDGSIDSATWITGNVPKQYNEAEGSYTINLDTNEASVDLDAGTNISTLLNGALTADDTTVTVDSTTTFASAGAAFTDGDKFSYTGTNGTQFTGVPGTGILGVIGHPDNTVVASMNRHHPFYKFRNWRSPNFPTGVTMEGASLTNGSEYVGTIKPFTYSYFAQDLSFYATLESATVNIGSDLTNSGCAFVDAKFGFGLECNASSEDATFTSTSNIDYAKGALEFWMKSTTASSDNTERTYFNIISGSDQFRFRKTTGNTLEFLMHDGTNAFTESVSSSDYGWSPNEWVHFKLTWDDSASATGQQTIYINRVEPTNTDSTGDLDGSLISPGTTFTLGNDSAAGSVHCNCILDEFYIFDLNGSGSNDQYIQLASGGSQDNSNEFLNDSSADYAFDFNDDDANNRGEYIWLATDSKFQGVNMNLATNGSGTSLNFDWEYWDGNSWEALTVTDTDSGVSQFTNDGNFYFDAPGNWLPYSISGSSDLYVIRGHLEGGTYSTDPVEDKILSDIIFVNYFGTLTSAAQTLEISAAANTAPNNPSTLSQLKTDDTVIVVADWTDETSVKFSASASDTDGSDTLQLCIEADLIANAFSNTEDSCGSGVAYSGSPVTVVHTLTGLTQGGEYHWQARVKDAASAYSSWVSFSTNTESDRDFGIDNTGPSTGTVYDGEVIATDADENDGDLTSLFANWSGIADTQSKLEKYQYAIGTTAGATDILTWTDKAEPGTLFSNGFESGDLSAWDSSSTDSGDLVASSSAQYLGLYGARATLDDTVAIYVQDDFTAAGDYYSRIYLNPNSLTMTSGDTFDLVDVRSSTTSRATLQLNYDGANYRVRGVLAVGPQNTAWVNIGASSWTSVEMRWFANASGLVSLWVDGVQYDTATGNTSSTTVDNVRIGAVSGIDATTTGSFYFDNFTSGASYLGPLNYIDQSIAASGHLHTGQQYFFSVRGVNNAGTTAGTTNSDGLQVLPTLSFSISTSSLTFLNLNSSNSWTDSQSLTTTTSTNGYGGYTVSMWSTQPLTNLFDGAYTIADYAGTNASPTSWTGTGFGYTTSDSDLGGGTANRFTNGGARYAGLINLGSGDPVADHTAAVTGTTGPIAAQQFNLTYRITSTANQAAGPYGTSIILIATPNF